MAPGLTSKPGRAGTHTGRREGGCPDSPEGVGGQVVGPDSPEEDREPSERPPSQRGDDCLVGVPAGPHPKLRERPSQWERPPQPVDRWLQVGREKEE